MKAAYDRDRRRGKPFVTGRAQRPRPQTVDSDHRVCLGRGSLHFHRPLDVTGVLTIRYGQARLRAVDREPDDPDGHSLLVQTFGSSFFRYGMNLMIY
jgi:hypothetical protein